ncbi:MAG: regulatory protein RecX [Clostridia bacterium]|nr:regulatory protein RecX [Clostridia bacterium]MBR6564452.1 regulatory protein RecX [Clostridia bacterium]
MQIVNLQKDKLHLTKLSLSDGRQVLVDNDLIFERSLKAGLEIDDKYLEELLFSSDYVRAKSRAVWYLDRSAHTEKGLYDKLVRAGFAKEACAKVIARFIEVGLLDDRRYAETLAERLIETNVSKREALQKMLSKGLPYDLAKAVLEETEADENTQIRNLIEKKYRNKLQQENGAKKVFDALARKGFSFGAIREALKRYIEESED